VLVAGLYIAFVLAVIRFSPTPHSRTPTDRFLTGAMSRDDERCWYAGGLFYYNPDDPAPLVPNRYYVGWTVNLGHPMARLVVVLVVGLLLVPVVLAITFNLPGSGCHTLDCVPS
jgi:uncharacterized membrane protein